MAVDMAELTRRAKQFFRLTSNVLWPERSLLSGEQGVGLGPLSPEEFASLTFISGPICDRCGVPQEMDYGPEFVCPVCIAKPPAWSRARAALVYDEASRRPILDLKYAGRRDGLKMLAQWMVRSGKDILEEADLLIPVPLHYSRLQSRGFNQAGWLAQSIAKQIDTPVKLRHLKRKRRTKSQGHLKPRARHRNVSGAFDIHESKKPDLLGRRVVLVDDVLTTGATLEACTRELQRAGVELLTSWCWRALCENEIPLYKVFGYRLGA